MMSRWLIGLALAVAASSIHADPRSTYQWMIKHQIVASYQVQSGAANVVIGSNFYNGDFTSQQTLCGTLLSYLQSMYPDVQQFRLVTAQGGVVGTYASGTLTLSSQ